MNLHFPWHRSEASRQRFMMAIAVLGSALASSPAIRLILEGESPVKGPQPLAPPLAPLACTLSTAMWTWLFVRFFREPSRSPLHFVWLAPLLGALNAGTSLALVTLGEGGGVGNALGALGGGTFFGTLYGGGPLGLVFGAMLAGFIAFARPLAKSADGDAPLRLLLGAATWLATVALLTVLADARSGAPVRWAPTALLFAAAVVSSASLATHVAVWRWTRRLRADLLPNYTLSRGLFVDQVFWRDRHAGGPFRSSDLTHAIGVVPKRAPWSSVLQSAALLIGLALAAVAAAEVTCERHPGDSCCSTASTLAATLT